MVVRNVSDQMLCNVAGFTVRNVAESVSPETVRNVSGQVSNVGGFMVPDVGHLNRTRPRNVADSDPKPSNVGDLPRNVSDQLRRDLLRNVADHLRTMPCNVA